MLIIMWIAAAIAVIANIAPFAKGLKLWEHIIVVIIIILGAPSILLVQAIELILDAFLEEGWNDDDDENFRY